MKPTDRSAGATKKRKSSRDPASGRFEESSPYTDPELLDQLVRIVRAVRDLEPYLSASVLQFKQLGDQPSAAMASMVGVYLSALKVEALRDISADPESYAEVKKRRLEAKALGNVPLAEQQRIQQMAAEWTLDGITPARLAQARPEILHSMMALAGAVRIGMPAGDLPSGVPGALPDLGEATKDLP